MGGSISGLQDRDLNIPQGQVDVGRYVHGILSALGLCWVYCLSCYSLGKGWREAGLI